MSDDRFDVFEDEDEPYDPDYCESCNDYHHADEWTEEDEVTPDPEPRKRVAYISGPMRGVPELNFPYFNKVEEKLKEEGWEVYNPARHGDGDYAELMRKDIVDVLNSDTIFLLPGWEDSEGARLEYQIGKALGKEFVIVDGAKDVPPVEMEAAGLVRSGERQSTYGHPARDFARTASHWKATLGTDVSPVQVALGMVGLKLSRLSGNQTHRDSLVDAIGYLICVERILDATPSDGQ